MIQVLWNLEDNINKQPISHGRSGGEENVTYALQWSQLRRVLLCFFTTLGFFSGTPGSRCCTPPPASPNLRGRKRTLGSDMVTMVTMVTKVSICRQAGRFEGIEDIFIRECTKLRNYANLTVVSRSSPDLRTLSRLYSPFLYWFPSAWVWKVVVDKSVYYIYCRNLILQDCFSLLFLRSPRTLVSIWNNSSLYPLTLKLCLFTDVLL